MAGKRLATLMAATPPPLILASASPARLRVMRGAGLRPEVEASGVDEADIGAETTAQTCLRLATAKAEAVAADRQEGIVIGCDSILDVNGERLGKPSFVRAPTDSAPQCTTTAVPVLSLTNAATARAPAHSATEK